MRGRRIGAIVAKDLGQVFRNRFMAVISLLLILLYALLYNLLPDRVEESFKMGLHLRGGEVYVAEGDGGGGPGSAEGFSVPSEVGRGVELAEADSLYELRALVEREEVGAGLFLDLSGHPPRLELFLNARTPEEVAGAAETLAREIAYSLLGFRLPVDLRTVVVGADMAGSQTPLRDKLRVLLLAFVFLLELYGLGNLLVEEIQHRTAQAVLVTSVSHAEFIAAKALTGMAIAFTEGLLLAVLLQAVDASTWFPVLVFLFLGAVLVVGFSFILGAVSRDFMSMAMISIVPFLILMLPGFAILYPGFTSPLLKAVPTWHLVEPLSGVLNYGKGLPDYLPAVFCLCLFSLASFWLGWYVLRRRLV